MKCNSTMSRIKRVEEPILYVFVISVLYMILNVNPVMFTNGEFKADRSITGSSVNHRSLKHTAKEQEGFHVFIIYLN